ncbi:MAG: MASE3 domain-containing protein [Negativicutes bacterium]|nr:MASE3 domain-containing protein [Negativicutes bacterium]MDR3593084.1 MASE3 domain-containing protein [Negativicutes bacterium]
MPQFAKGAATLKQLLPLFASGALVFVIFSGLTSLTLEPYKLQIFHGILEMASIIIGFIVFYITWYGASSTTGIRVTVISLTIITSAILELVHLLSFPGIAADTAGNGHVWVTSWIFSRLVWSFGMLYATGLPTSCNGQSPSANRTLLYCSLVAVAALIANILFNSSFLPVLNVDSLDQPAVAVTHYAAVAAEVVAIIILRRYYPNHVGNLPQYALLFAVLSDLSFCLAPHATASLNVTGHMFKILANFYVLRSLYIRVIRQPYDEVIKLKEETESLAEKNAKLYQESEHQRSLVEDVLSKIGMIISSRLDVKETLEGIADMVAGVRCCHKRKKSPAGRRELALDVKSPPAARFGCRL